MLTRKQYWYNIMKLDKHHKNIEEIDVSCQIPVNNHGNTDTDIVTVIGNVKQVRFNNNVYATLIPTKEELNKVYMDYKQHNIDILGCIHK